MGVFFWKHQITDISMSQLRYLQFHSTKPFWSNNCKNVE